MKFVQIKITISNEAVGAVSNLLFEIGAEGIEFEEINDSSLTVLKTYFLSDDLIGERVNRIKNFMNELREIGLETKPESIEIKGIENKDWIQEGRSQFPPQRVGKRILVAATWLSELDLNPDDIVIRIDPGMAFGTAHHPTTILSIKLLEKYIKGGEKVADIGTGTGILAIAAAKLGAKWVQAVDIDETAVSVARQNIELNDVDRRIDIGVGRSLADIYEEFHLITVNILTSVILPMIPQFPKYLESSGKLILSGIKESEASSIEDALKIYDFELTEKLVSEEWIAILAKRILG